MSLHVVCDEPDDDREQDDGPDDMRFDEFGFTASTDSTPAYASGRRKQVERPAKLELSAPPKDIAEITSQMRDAFSRLNAFAKVDLADLAALDGLPPKTAHDAQLAWTNLLLRSEIRSKRSTGVVRASVEALTKPFRIGRRAVEAGLATLIKLDLVRAFHESKRKARTYVLVPVYMRFRETSSPSHGGASSERLAGSSPSHVDGLSPSHVVPFSPSSPSHGGSFSAPTTPTLPSGSSEAPSLVAGLLDQADHAAAAPTTPAGAAGAARPAAAAAKAAASPLDRSTWDRLIARDAYTWQEDEVSISIETKLFYEDEQGVNRAVHIALDIDTITEGVLVHFPRSKFASPRIPWEHVKQQAAKTWQQFAGASHGYSIWDYLICVERWLYGFARRGNTVDSPVGCLRMVSKDILDRHRWGECAFTDHRFARPKEPTKS